MACVDGHSASLTNATQADVVHLSAPWFPSLCFSSRRPDPGHSLAEERLVIFGVSHRGRLLAVMFTERRQLEAGDEVEIVRIISAREATRSERTAYEEGI